MYTVDYIFIAFCLFIKYVYSALKIANNYIYMHVNSLKAIKKSENHMHYFGMPDLLKVGFR